MELRDVLKILRRELGMSQSELAAAMHVSYTTVNRWEAGRTCPNPSILAILVRFARSRSVSEGCIDSLKQAIADAKRTKIAKSRDALYSVEHSSLSRLIDDASFPIYVCDMETDELLYANRKACELLGSGSSRLIGKKCYKCFMHRDTPCPFCRKEELEADRFTAFQAFIPEDNRHHLVQGKLIQWNGRRAQVRYIVDVTSSLGASDTGDRQKAYNDQSSLRRELAGDALAAARYNLTRDTVGDVVGSREDIAAYISAHCFSDALCALRERCVSGGELRKLDDCRDRRAMIRRFYAGMTRIAVRHFIDGSGGYCECVIDLMQNPATYDIEAFIQIRDITDAAMTEVIAKRLFNTDYDTVVTIDALTGEARPYIGEHLSEVIRAQRRESDNMAGIATYLRERCADDDVERVIRGTSLDYVKQRLTADESYHITYSIKHDGRIIYRRAVYAYLDGRRSTILCAMQDLTDLHAFEDAKRDRLDDALCTLQEQSGMNISRYDVKTKTLYSNCAMTACLGYGAVIKNVPDVFIDDGHVAPASADEFRAFFDNLCAGKVSLMHAQLEVQGGQFHWVRVNARLITNGGGKVKQAIIVFQDVEELREQATVYAKWRQSLEQKKPAGYTLFRSNLSRGTEFDKIDGTLLRHELFDFSLKTVNERARSYASRFVHIDDFDAYVTLVNTENLLAGYYRGVHSAELCYRELVSEDEYRSIRLTAELAQYPDSADVELFLLYEPCEPAETRPAAHGGHAVFDDTGVMVVTSDWATGRFTYPPELSASVAGRYDDRPIWEIFLSDGVADAQDVKVLRELAREVALTRKRNNGAMELVLKTPTGARHWFSINVFKRADAQGAASLLVLTLLDINDDILANRKLRFQAERDSLTGLYNRSTFLKLVAETVRCKPADTYILLCSDINDFEIFNNRYGREEGDRLLIYSAERLRGYAEAKNGFAGRLSNDIFAILLPNTEGVLSRAEGAVRDHFGGYPLKARVTARAGVYVISDPAMKPDTMLDRAITAKDAIKGKYDKWLAVYDDGMNEARLREKYITDRMETALAEGQFDVYIQPQFHHGTGQIVGAEALVRWNDPERGVVLPGEFIPVFEKNGFITRMDGYVWDRAARYISDWMLGGNEPVPISVNVSREDLRDPELCQRLVAIIEKYSLPASIFRLEITESLFAEEPKRLAAIVDELHSHGFIVEMDDFGSGYSSLNILKDVPVDILKLDMRFFTGVDNLGRGGIILNAVMRMSRWLGIPVIAEGVELKDQADFLLSIGCPTIQGYLYERPLPARSFEKLLYEGRGKPLIPRGVIDSELDVNSFWNPLSGDSRFFNDYIGPAFIFEYHGGEYEIVRMNRRFIDAMMISEAVMLPAKGLIHIYDEDKPRVKKAVLDALYTGSDSRVVVRCLRDDGSTPVFHVTLRVIAKSADRVLIFAALEG